MNLQDMVDGMNARMQRASAESQMTLGGMIAALEAMPDNAVVANLDAAHSYRGYYSDLAFSQQDGVRSASSLLGLCRAAMGVVMEGYKGGDFQMGAMTPVWVANYGDCGKKLIAIRPDGTLDTASDD